jgi:hypothetical protein
MALTTSMNGHIAVAMLASVLLVNRCISMLMVGWSPGQQ